MKSFQELEEQQDKENPTAYKRFSNFMCRKGHHTLTRRKFRENGYHKKACKNCNQTRYIG